MRPAASGCIDHARATSPCASACSARVRPQPGQCSPVTQVEHARRQQTAGRMRIERAQQPRRRTARLRRAARRRPRAAMRPRVATRAFIGRDWSRCSISCSNCSYFAMPPVLKKYTVHSRPAAHSPVLIQHHSLALREAQLRADVVALVALAVDLRGEHDRDDARDRADDAAEEQRGDGDQDRPQQVVRYRHRRRPGRRHVGGGRVGRRHAHGDPSSVRRRTSGAADPRQRAVVGS